MKRIFLFLIFTIGAVSLSNAQDTYVYELRPDTYVTKEVVLKGLNAIEELKITVGVKWMQKENQIQLTFDRKIAEGDDAYFLLFPLINKKTPIGNVADYKSQKKTLWSKEKSDELKYMSYFLESDHLNITDYKGSYKSLANNNEEEFDFEIKNLEDFSINLNGMYVARTVKENWRSFSSRDKKLEYKVNPINLEIHFLQIQQKKQLNLCSNSEQIVTYINAQKQILNADYDELSDAQKNQNCTLFGLIKDKIRRNFVENNDKCEKYAAACEEIAQAIKSYNDQCESIMNEQCRSSVSTSSACSLSEQEITAINNRLVKLQMQINIKKKGGTNFDEEYKDYQSIKAAVNGKLTPECRRKYKSSIDAFTNYCAKIESLF